MIYIKNKSQPNREILGVLSNLELVKKGNSKARNHSVHLISFSRRQNPTINQSPKHPSKPQKEMGKILS